MLMISEGNLGDATSLIARAGEELKMQEYRWYTSELGCGFLKEAYQVFDEMRRYYEAQQEFHIHPFGERGMGEVAYLKKVNEKAATRFEETAVTYEVSKQ